MKDLSFCGFAWESKSFGDPQRAGQAPPSLSPSLLPPLTAQGSRNALTPWRRDWGDRPRPCSASRPAADQHPADGTHSFLVPGPLLQAALAA